MAYRNPRLVVETGLPRAGKSTAAEYLRDELGFNLLSTDEFRASLYGVIDTENYSNNLDTEIKERLILKLLNHGKFLSIFNGLDTVIDSTAFNEQLRRFYLALPLHEEINPEKYLIHIDADNDVLVARTSESGRTTKGLEYLSEQFQSLPESIPDAKIIRYPSNTSEELDAMLSDLNKRFRREPKTKTFS